MLAHRHGHHAATKAVHALLYLIVSLLAVAMVFFVLGAPFVAALEVIVYAGAIMVLFVFVIMMLNLGAAGRGAGNAPGSAQGLDRARPCSPLVLLGELVYVLARSARPRPPAPCVVARRRSASRSSGPTCSASNWPRMLLLAAPGRRLHLGRKPRRAGARRRATMAAIPVEHGLMLAGGLFLPRSGRRPGRAATSSSSSCPSRSCSTPPGSPSSSPAARWQQADGQVMFFFILTMAAAEVAVGLALVLRLYHGSSTLDTDAASRYARVRCSRLALARSGFASGGVPRPGPRGGRRPAASSRPSSASAPSRLSASSPSSPSQCLHPRAASGGAFTQNLWTWMPVDDLACRLSAFYLDALSLVMILVVTFVAFLILLYSVGFMRDDDGYSRFFA